MTGRCGTMLILWPLLRWILLQACSLTSIEAFCWRIVTWAIMLLNLPLTDARAAALTRSRCYHRKSGSKCWRALFQNPNADEKELHNSRVNLHGSFLLVEKKLLFVCQQMACFLHND